MSLRLLSRCLGLAAVLLVGSLNCLAFTAKSVFHHSAAINTVSSGPTRLFSSPPSSSSSESSSASSPAAPEAAAAPAIPEVVFTRNPDVTPTDEWELDCYSRPVVVNGKKLWEVLLTDSAGSFRFAKTLPSNQVNSKQVRATIEQFQEEYVDQHNLEQPSVIRFFRGAMFNMLNIALTDLDVISRPSRCTFALAQWLEERHRDVYPKMEG